jgi:hypothetical protein
LKRGDRFAYACLEKEFYRLGRAIQMARPFFNNPNAGFGITSSHQLSIWHLQEPCSPRRSAIIESDSPPGSGTGLAAKAKPEAFITDAAGIPDGALS